MTDTSSPSPTGVADADDDAPLVERLHGSAPPPSPDNLRTVSRLVTLAILLVLLIVGGTQLWPRPAVERVKHALASPTTMPVAPSEWEIRGPADASAVAFGQSPPSAGYACGPDSAPLGSAPPQAIHLYSTANAGSTWQQLAFQIANLPSNGDVHGFFGVSCALSVDPADSKDVALLVGYQACGQGVANALYRTRDGGATWQQMTLPDLDSSGEQAQASEWIAWVGSTLYVRAVAPCGTAINRLAVSTNDSAFHWVNEDALFAGAPSDATLGTLTPVAPYLYVRLDSRANCPPTCRLYQRTRDGGQTWEDFTPVWQGHELGPLDDYLVQQGAHALYAQYYPDGQDLCSVQRAYYRSTDEGATWTQLPGLPAGLYIEQVVDTTDETIYAAVTSICSGTASQWGIYRLHSLQAPWVRVAVDPLDPISLTWDSSGHPAGLWATPLSQAQARYLVYHTP